MQQSAQIGPSVVIKGDVTANEPLAIAGRVEGRVEVVAHAVTIAAGAHVEGDVAAENIVVAGNMQGKMVAEGRIELRGTASVEGEVVAPRIAVEDGAILCGKVAVAGNRAAELARAS